MDDLNVTCRDFIDYVVDVLINFLQDEIQIQGTKNISEPMDLQKLQLRYMTSIISVESNIKMLFAFSFDKALIEEIFRRYAQDIEIDENEIGIYIEETAGELINIVIGNAIAKLNYKNHIISLSPPVVIMEAKSITRIKESEFLTFKIDTKFGGIEIFCVCPKDFKELFGSKTNQMEVI